MAGAIVRRREAISGVLEVTAERMRGDLFKLTVRVSNRAPLPGAAALSRDQALLQALVSTHAILHVRDGEFLSLMDPPEECRALAAACRNTGTFPVLAGEEGEHDLLLSSPIILYDYPQTAPESAGDLYDGTEIDEILSLRILTMTDEEKQEARDADPRACDLLDRTETLPPEVLMRLHGVLRNVRPLNEELS